MIYEHDKPNIKMWAAKGTRKPHRGTILATKGITNAHIVVHRAHWLLVLALCCCRAPAVSAGGGWRAPHSDEVVRRHIKTAISLSKYSYTKSQYNVPKEVWRSGSISQEPLVELEDGLHGYAFLSATGTRFVVIRGTKLGSFDDLRQDYSLFGGRQPGHIHPWVNPGQLTATDLRDLRQKMHSNTSWLFDSVASSSYVTKALQLMEHIRKHPKLKYAKETVFVGHSLGGTLAAILSIVNDSPAIVFNAPGWYLSTEWLCREMGLEQSIEASYKVRLTEVRRRLCEMDPEVPYPVWNIFLQEDVLPHTFDYGLGFACPIPYERVQEAFILQPGLIEAITKVKLFSLLDINFPAGLASCRFFETITQLHDIFNFAFLECFGAAHHVQVIYKIVKDILSPEDISKYCRPVVAPSKGECRLPQPMSKQQVPYLEFVEVLSRGNAMTNLMANLIFFSRTFRYTWPLWGFIPTALYALWYRRKAKCNYDNMIRMNQVSIILASIDMKNSRFSLRVLKERRLEDLLFGDTYAQRLVLEAAARTTKERPVLAFASPGKDSWPIHLAVISNLYEQFADGLLQADMGLMVHSEWYVFAISCFPDEESSRKLRVYLVKMSVLNQLHDESQLDQNIYSSWRRSRKNAFCVLKEMARIAREHRQQDPKRTVPMHKLRGYDMPSQLARVELTMRATYCPGCVGACIGKRVWYLDEQSGRTVVDVQKGYDLVGDDSTPNGPAGELLAPADSGGAVLK